ncbi:hypothetical protein [Metabacillus halosaccharovorans]|nr:hypothetical protein [Metabacillus halosaccharovorans]
MYRKDKKANRQKILGFCPIIDKTLREHFPQYVIKQLFNNTLIHYPLGG